MRAISSKINIYIRSITIINNNLEKLLLNSLFCFFGALILFYVFLLGNMVKNIVERQGFELRTRALSNEVLNLQVTYLAMSNSVDIARAHSLGFKEVQPSFSARKSLGSVKTPHNDL